MSNKEWPANDYAVGAYVQAHISDEFLPLLRLKPNAQVLDVGCGDAAYTRRILDMVPKGSVLGIDPSQNMLNLAEKVRDDYPNLSLQLNDVLDMDFTEQFDQVVSFWCLQWTGDIQKAFRKIHQALKPGGRVFAIMPSGNDPFINGYYALKKSGKFPFLQGFKPPMEYEKYDNLKQQLDNIPFKQMQVEQQAPSVTLPSLDYFRKFMKGLAFYQGQVSDAELEQIHNALLQRYDEECQKNWGGEYRFILHSYVIRGEK